MDITYGKETRETDTLKVVWCRGFKKFLDVGSCTAEKCKYHYQRKSEEVRQGEKTVAVVDRVLCGYPRWEQIVQVCEVI